MNRLELTPIFFFLLFCFSCQREIKNIRCSNRIEYYINYEASDSSRAAVVSAFSIWDESTSFNFALAGTNKAGLSHDGKNTVSFVEKWPKSLPFVIAYCMNWYDSAGYIIESDIILNCQLASFTDHVANHQNAYYVEGVLVHEIGHMLGFGHSEETDSVMGEIFSIADSKAIQSIDNMTLSVYNKLYGYSSRRIK